MSRSQLVLSIGQLNELRTTLAQLGQQADVRCAMLADLSGQDVVSWAVKNTIDMSTVAALAAGDMLATLEIGRMLGGQRSCNLTVQEYDEQTVLIARVGLGLLLLVATAREVPLGWARLAIKRTSDRILAIVGAAAMTPPPLAVDDEFESAFAAQLDTIW